MHLWSLSSRERRRHDSKPQKVFWEKAVILAVFSCIRVTEIYNELSSKYHLPQKLATNRIDELTSISKIISYLGYDLERHLISEIAIANSI